MQQCLARDFDSVPPHPLIYASLEPCHSPSFAQRMDLHRPKAEHTVGRGPMNDFVLNDEQSGQIDWTHCTLSLDEHGDVQLIENYTTNGIWVNNRLLSPGESCTLKDGDSVKFGKCVLAHSKTHDLRRIGYNRGNCFSYTFRSFVTRNPPGLSVTNGKLREQFLNLERARASILEERARLDKRLEELEKENVRIIESLPVVPPTKPANTLSRAQGRYKQQADDVRPDYSDFFPEDVRDFRPQPWLPPDVRPDNDSLDLSLYEIYRSFGAPPNKRPPPLPKDHTMNYFTRALHHDDAPSWNDPDVVWGDLQALNLSTPLNVPPSIIFWSIEYHLPVYMHPNFLKASRKGPYAHPYASSEYVFSDESAALNRKEWGLPPLRDSYPLRPTVALKYRIKEYRTIPDEEELAEWVTLLHGRRALSPRGSSFEPPSPQSGAISTASALDSYQRSRMTNLLRLPTSARPADERTDTPAFPTVPPGHDCSVPDGAEHVSLYPPPSILAHVPARSSSPQSSVDDDHSSQIVLARPAKRRKTSHSPNPSLPIASGACAVPPDEVKLTVRTTPEPLSRPDDTRGDLVATHTAKCSGHVPKRSSDDRIPLPTLPTESRSRSPKAPITSDN